MTTNSFSVSKLVFIIACSQELFAVRLHNLFQFIDGFRSEHNLQGFLHVGNDYAVFLKKPEPHDKYLVYELYEVKNVEELRNYQPRLLAISKVPVEYIKNQLKTFREELYKAKYEGGSVIPGTQVQTLREWQIERAINFDNTKILKNEMPILRTILR
ncbi:uncharacterized protein LOC119629819 [Bombyx mori]|uniref:Uncharacterized protein n=1 Tax=Bombyx mori TaxID=7091 RepID=A0A8R2R3W0_BOMMO|nr:uncharacterized protein LOC119629819 [Bombyx mori]